MLKRFINAIHRTLCSHPPSRSIKRGQGTGRYWVECMDCEFKSRGIDLVKRYTTTYGEVV